MVERLKIKEHAVRSNDNGIRAKLNPKAFVYIYSKKV